MKFNLKGIRFKTWLYFLSFSFTMIFLLGFLMVALIKPYYRQNRLDTIDSIVAYLENNLFLSSDQDSAKEASRLIMSNNACVFVYNEAGKEVYESDSLGQLCMLNRPLDFYGETFSLRQRPQGLLDVLKERSSFSFDVDNEGTSVNMLVYGKLIRGDLANYYLVINTPLELVESYVDFLMNQYFLIAAFILAIAFVVSYFFASNISLPIIGMKKTAAKLAEGDYSVDFKADSYSEINELAGVLNAAKDKLESVDELRKDLVANVSHDIKTPLTMIRAYAEMILDISGDNPLKREEHLKTILHETEYLSRLTDDMQMYSKMQAGIIELNKSNVELLQLSNDVVELLRSLMDEKHIVFVLKGDDVMVYGDEVKLSQVVYNFLSNAIKHSSDGGWIEVEIKDLEDSVYFGVSDNGDGISAEALPYIWDRYYKIDKSFRRNENSTGLGLAIAKAILEAHRAKYGVESVEGKGSRFYFELSKGFEDE